MSTQRRPRWVRAAALVVGLAVLLLLGSPRPASAAAAAPALDTTFSALLNTLRTSLGIGTLTLDDELSGIARAWSVEMASSGTLSHNGALSSQATGWAKLGENVGTGDSVTLIFNALVASPPHMRNMADGQFTRVGIGTVIDGQGRLWTTHVFMRPKTAVSLSAPAPTAAPVTRAPAPATTRAPKPAHATASSATSPPSGAAPAATPATIPVLTTVAAPVIEAASTEPSQATTTLFAPAMEPGSGRLTEDQGIPPPVIASSGLLVLLVLCSGGSLLRRRPPGSNSPVR